MDLSNTWNADYMEQQYRRWLHDPAAVSSEWRFFFEGFELADSGDTTVTGPPDQEFIQKRLQVENLINRYRRIGHLLACLDPLAACPSDHPLLNISSFGLSAKDLDVPFDASAFTNGRPTPLRDIVSALKATYCRSIGVEYMHLQDPAERRWLQERMEPERNAPRLDQTTRVRMLDMLCRTAAFESFLHKKYQAQTRFSIQGADVIVAMLDQLFEHLATAGCIEILLGMAHRGRLSVQTQVLQRPYEEIFDEFGSCYDPEGLVGAGDVKYHNGYLTDIETQDGRPLRVFLVNNPSHLEAVDPVAEGIARGRQDILADTDGAKVIPLLIHGDAAFAGQGVVAETLNLSQLEGYRTGGTIHTIINNQIGYTTLPENARSTRYSTDIAKMLMVPIFHVHGENPEAVLHAVRLAADYRMAFKKDVVVDIICYRRYGHNEGDDPYFTQPLMYERIKSRPSLHELYAQTLKADNAITESEIEAIQTGARQQIEIAFETSGRESCPFPETRFYENWKPFHGQYSHTHHPTGVDPKTLLTLARTINRIPTGFSLNPKLERLLKNRLDAVEGKIGIDWANAEALALASILDQGRPIRLSGQDSGRGTFSQRHSVLFDTKTGSRYIPLAHLGKSQARFSVFDSLLSEAGVLGFDYGYSLARPEGLTLWEAQFGDFANNAQSVIDLFIASGESKWQRLSGLVMLLPHGYEGLGPEHSSARLERYLQLCAEDNLQVCYPTTPAQYFHLLRRQVFRQVRKPLIVMAPKSLLRHPKAVSSLSDLSGGHFREVHGDTSAGKKLSRVLFCSGKIYYELLQKQAALASDDTAIVRIEQFYPFPQDRLKKIIDAYGRIEKWRWVQEEPRNMGGWSFIRPRLETLIGRPLEYAGRDACASTATGFPNVYKNQQAALLESAFRS